MNERSGTLNSQQQIVPQVPPSFIRTTPHNSQIVDGLLESPGSAPIYYFGGDPTHTSDKNHGSILTNFKEEPLTIEGKNFPSPEAYFQWKKTEIADPVNAEKHYANISQLPLSKVKDYVRDKNNPLLKGQSINDLAEQKGWHDPKNPNSKFSAMEKLIDARWEQSRDFKAKILSLPKDTQFVETAISHNDQNWAVDASGKGNNWLGEIITRRRDKALDIPQSPKSWLPQPSPSKEPLFGQSLMGLNTTATTLHSGSQRRGKVLQKKFHPYAGGARNHGGKQLSSHQRTGKSTGREIGAFVPPSIPGRSGPIESAWEPYKGRANHHASQQNLADKYNVKYVDECPVFESKSTGENLFKESKNGKKVILLNRKDEAIVGALHHAASKNHGPTKSVRLQGSDAFKNRAIPLAVKNGIKIDTSCLSLQQSEMYQHLTSQNARSPVPPQNSRGPR